jgi:hypothetical protein
VKPSWAKEYTHTADIGLFRFYKPQGGDAK